MELPMAIVIGALFAAGTYLMLRPSLIRIVLGLALYTNGANLTMMTCGGYESSRSAPFLYDASGQARLMDPLPPVIILTAIVISFSVWALLLILCYRVYLDWGTDDPEALASIELHEVEEESAATQS